MGSGDRLVDEIANDFMLLCTPNDKTVDATQLGVRLQMFASLLSTDLSDNPSGRTFAEELSRDAANMSDLSAPADFRERLNDLSRMQRARLQKLEHEMMAKLINKNDDKSTLLNEESNIRQSLVAIGDQLKALNNSDNVRRLAAHLLWHLATGLEASFKCDPPEEDLPEIDSDNYDLS